MDDLSLHNTQTTKHYVAVANDIGQICEPFFRATGINYFVYIRIFDDGSRIFLSTNGRWSEYYVNAGFHRHHQHTLSYISNKKNAYALWQGFRSDPVFSTAYEFDIWNGFNIYSSGQQKNEAFLFGSSRTNHRIINFYLNNIPFLKSFFDYFRERAAHLITPAKNNILLVPDYTQSQPYVSHLLNSYLTTYHPQIKRSTDKDHSQQNRQLATSILSQREVQCLSWTAQGKTSDEISTILGLSAHTVREYLKGAIKKMNAKNKTMAVAKAINSNLIDIQHLL